MASFIKQFLGGPSDVDIESLQEENAYLKEKVKELESTISELTVNALNEFIFSYRRVK
jgi:hypothetical protein